MTEEKEQWVTRREATAILSRNAGRPIHYDQVYVMGMRGQIATRKLDGRTSLYKLSDLENYHIKQRKQREELQAATH